MNIVSAIFIALTLSASVGAESAGSRLESFIYFPKSSSYFSCNSRFIETIDAIIGSRPAEVDPDRIDGIRRSWVIIHRDKTLECRGSYLLRDGKAYSIPESIRKALYKVDKLQDRLKYEFDAFENLHEAISGGFSSGASGSTPPEKGMFVTSSVRDQFCQLKEQNAFGGYIRQLLKQNPAGVEDNIRRARFQPWGIFVDGVPYSFESDSLVNLNDGRRYSDGRRLLHRYAQFVAMNENLTRGLFTSIDKMNRLIAGSNKEDSGRFK